MNIVLKLSEVSEIKINQSIKPKNSFNEHEMEYYISTVIITQLSLLTLNVLISKNKVLSKHKTKGIVISSSLIMLCSLAELFGVLLDGSIIFPRTVHIAVKYVEFFTAPIIPMVVSTAFYPIKSKKLVFFPSIIHIVLETINLFFNFIFYVDKNNIYHHGKAYLVYYLFVFLSVLYLFYTVDRYASQFQNRNYISLLLVFAFLIMGIVFNIIDNHINIVWLTAAIAMILFYIYYCNMMNQLDVLTELLNRRTYEVHKSSLKRKAFILIIDVNNFKDVNDRLGHTLGDSCLKTIASVIRNVYKKYGRSYRIGGDEFCVIIDKIFNFSNINIEDLNSKLHEKLSRQRWESEKIPSVAIGYALFDPKTMQISDAIKEADAQMYKNKKQIKSF